MIGILALQGGYEAHANVLTKLQTSWRYVRNVEDLNNLDGLILPGGESTTILNLLKTSCLDKAIQELDIPIFGTCAGAIIMAKEVLSPKQRSLNLIDVTIERNAYGRQIASQISKGTNCIDNSEMEMCFIRAPKITKIGKDVKIIAKYKEEPVCVQQGHFLISTFHPELTKDATLHHYFLELTGKR